jgi:hypothetical protein
MRETMRNHETGSTASLEVTFDFHPRNGKKNGGPNPADTHGISEQGNVPRVSRLMALAIRFDGLVRTGEIEDYADLARLGYVSRARITQIMNLLNLAPDIQEEILFLPKTTKGRDPIREKDLRPIAAIPQWNRQRKMWAHCSVV